MADQLPKISLIIATYNRQSALRETLADALALDYPDFEIIVVDQSTPPAAGLDPRINLVATQPPHLPRARNIGVKAAQGELVVFVDDDVALPPLFLQAHAACYANAQVGGVAGRVILDPNPPRPLQSSPPTNNDFDQLERRETMVTRGCNMSFRRAALTRARLFDERYSPIAWSEEEDVCFAMRRQGWRLVFEPEAWLIHRQNPNGGMRTETRGPADRVDFYRDRIYFAFKNVGGLDFWRVVWDLYRHTLPPRATGAKIVQRQFLWGKGLLAGLGTFLAYGSRPKPLPYRLK